MGPKDVFETLKARFADAAEWKEGHAGEPYAIVDAGKIVEVARFLKETHGLLFDCLSNLTGVDLVKLKLDRIAVVYHLFSYSQRHSFVMKVHLDRTAPTVSTLSGVWRAAAYMEREVFDLLGVKFEGHPDLRRILLPEDWVGYPLRKDYTEEATYQGIPTTRPNPLELIPLGMAEEIKNA
ncbi:MAG: NADH-quinone oxidoreductase subunit C [Deltaproteobacteria bacterium]|nr:NADH-quinone oxidoreductase subunit C [Deltaproteobacteria bacterium]